MNCCRESIGIPRWEEETVLTVTEVLTGATGTRRDDRNATCHGLQRSEPEGLIPFTREHQYVGILVSRCQFGPGTSREPEPLARPRLSDDLLHHRRRLSKLGHRRSFSPGWGGSLWAAEDPPPRPGNVLDVLIDGEEVLPAVEQAIRAARA